VLIRGKIPPDPLTRGCPPPGPRAPYGGTPGTLGLSGRAFRCWLNAVPADLRSSVWSSVLGPLFYLGALGFGLGSLVDKHGRQAPAG